jgi:hypothetical protein
MKWTHRPTIMSYIVDCYAGTEPLPGSTQPRRVFLWEEGELVKMGNTEAFLAHLVARFRLTVSSTGTTVIHTLLRELGERVLPPCPDKRARRPVGDRLFKAPDPDSWVVGRVQHE